MTRDTKLALILGSSILLLVLLLISDHIAATARPEQGAPASSLANAAAPPNQPGLGQASRALAGNPRAAASADRPTTADPLTSRTERSTWRDGLANAVDSAVATTRDLLAADGMGPAHQAEPPAAETPTTTVMGVPLDDNPPAPNNPDQAGDERTHLVREGDTLWSIAERYYNDPELHAAIARANRDRLTPNGTLAANTRIVIPPRDRLAATPQPPTTEPANPDDNDQPTYTTYTVRKGDVLSVISQRTLGTAKRWREILELNKDKLDEPEDLWVGMTLRIPAN